MINVIKIKTRSYSILIIEPLEKELVIGKTIDYISNNLKLISHTVETKSMPSTRLDILEIEEDELFEKFLTLLEQPEMKHDFHYFELNKTEE